MLISAEELRLVMPTAGARVDTYLDPLNAALDEFDIDNPDRVAAFLANIAHESRELARMEEDLYYTTPSHLADVFPSSFRSAGDAAPFCRNPMALANRVYANKYGNGDESSGDGWRCRGSGCMQVTFKATHAQAAAHFSMGVYAFGDWARTTPEGAMRSGAWYWWRNALSVLADQGYFTTVVKRINPSLVGMDSRRDYWERAREVFA